MMINIYDSKYNMILNPFAIENLWQLKSFYTDNIENIEFEKLKGIVIHTLSFLMDKRLIYILESNFMNGDNFVKANLSNERIIDKINAKWTVNIDDDELYNLAWFKFEDWYINGLSDKGLTPYNNDWNDFILNKVGDLEKWINENKPKDGEK